jgi:hypothetical protein
MKNQPKPGPKGRRHQPLAHRVPPVHPAPRPAAPAAPVAAAPKPAPAPPVAAKPVAPPTPKAPVPGSPADHRAERRADSLAASGSPARKISDHIAGRLRAEANRRLAERATRRPLQLFARA